MITQVTNKGGAIGGAGSYSPDISIISGDTNLINAFNAAVPVLDVNNNIQYLGYYDDFPGVALDSSWTLIQESGSIGTATVTGGYVQLSNDTINKGTAIYKSIIPNANFEAWIHMDINSSSSYDRMYIQFSEGIWPTAPGFFVRVFLERDSGGTRKLGYQASWASEGSNIIGGTNQDANWIYISYHAGLLGCASSILSSATDPSIMSTDSAVGWLYSASTNSGILRPFKPKYLTLIAKKTSGALTTNYRFRHLRIKYI